MTRQRADGDSEHKDGVSDSLEAKLKSLGDKVLEEKVPDALLEVLRRRFAERSVTGDSQKSDPLPLDESQ